MGTFRISKVILQLPIEKGPRQEADKRLTSQDRKDPCTLNTMLCVKTFRWTNILSSYYQPAVC